MKNKEQKISKSRNIPFIFTREERELYMSIENKKKNIKEDK